MIEMKHCHPCHCNVILCIDYDRTSCLQQGRTFPGGVHFIVYWCACSEFLGQIEKCYHFPNQGSGAHTVRLSGFSPPFFWGRLMDWAWYVFGIGAHTVPEHRVLRLDLVITPFSWPPLPSPCFFSASLCYVVQ